MKILITGGAGFIGVNSAHYFANQGHEVTIFDNLSRAGSSKNLEWIQSNCNVNFFQGDLRKFVDLVDVFNNHGKFDLILHLAAQVAVTTSVTNPHEDFEIKGEIQPDLPEAFFDADAFGQAVSNLIDNAVKYSGDSREIVLRGFTEDGNVAIAVKDFGIGMDRKAIGRPGVSGTPRQRRAAVRYHHQHEYVEG